MGREAAVLMLDGAYAGKDLHKCSRLPGEGLLRPAQATGTEGDREPIAAEQYPIHFGDGKSLDLEVLQAIRVRRDYAVATGGIREPAIGLSSGRIESLASPSVRPLQRLQKRGPKRRFPRPGTAVDQSRSRH